MNPVIHYVWKETFWFKSDSFTQIQLRYVMRNIDLSTPFSNTVGKQEVDEAISV